LSSVYSTGWVTPHSQVAVALGAVSTLAFFLGGILFGTTANKGNFKSV
jgi:hypothetical protein